MRPITLALAGLLLTIVTGASWAQRGSNGTPYTEPSSEIVGNLPYYVAIYPPGLSQELGGFCITFLVPVIGTDSFKGPLHCHGARLGQLRIYKGRDEWCEADDGCYQATVFGEKEFHWAMPEHEDWGYSVVGDFDLAHTPHNEADPEIQRARSPQEACELSEIGTGPDGLPAATNVTLFEGDYFLSIGAEIVADGSSTSTFFPFACRYLVKRSSIAHGGMGDGDGDDTISTILVGASAHCGDSCGGSQMVPRLFESNWSLTAILRHDTDRWQALEGILSGYRGRTYQGVVMQVQSGSPPNAESEDSPVRTEPPSGDRIEEGH